jgi:hypothetical protein
MRATKSQIAYLGNLLNEVLNGFAVGDFYAAIGASRDAVVILVDRLEENYLACRDHEPRDLPLSGNEALILKNASLLCSQKLTREEFQTRLGETAHGANKILRLLEVAEEPRKVASLT